MLLFLVRHCRISMPFDFKLHLFPMALSCYAPTTKVVLELCNLTYTSSPCAAFVSVRISACPWQISVFACQSLCVIRLFKCNRNQETLHHPFYHEVP